MLDSLMGKVLGTPLAAVGRSLARRDIDATTVTLAGAAAGLLAAGTIAMGWYQFGLILFALNRLCDGLDGAVARATHATDFGGFLDIVVDFVIYAALAGAFALADPHHATVAVLLMVAFAGTGTSFLAFASIAAKRGLEAHAEKSLFYLSGLTEGTETIIFFMIVCLWPEWFNTAGLVFVLACWVTVGQRIVAAYRTFTPPL